MTSVLLSSEKRVSPSQLELLRLVLWSGSVGASNLELRGIFGARRLVYSCLSSLLVAPPEVVTTHTGSPLSLFGVKKTCMRHRLYRHTTRLMMGDAHVL